MTKLLFSLLFAILLMGIISAETFTFDNIKSFEKTADSYGVATISNSILGIKTSDLMKVELKKNTDFCFINCSAEGTAELYEDTWLFTDAYFKNLNTNKETDIYYKIYIQDGTIKGEQEVRTCSDRRGAYNYINSSYEIIKDCKTDYVTIDVPNWISYNGEKLKKGNYNWRIEGKIGANDNIDWIGNFDGVDISEWATWNSTFNASLIHYWSMKDAGQSYASDWIAPSNANASFFGSPTWVAGINGYGLKISNGNYVGTGQITIPTGTAAFTMSMWFKPESPTGIMQFFNIGTYALGSLNISWDISGNKLILDRGGGFSGTAVVNTGWQHIVADCNSGSSSCDIYLNGTLIATSNAGANGPANTTVLMGLLSGTGDVIIDEVAIWDRKLGATEVASLYDNGAGTFYQVETTFPLITLNSPINHYNSSSSSVIFNCSASSLTGKINNISLWLNGERNYTLTTGTSNFSELYISRTLADGVYNWTCYADDNTTITNTGWATNRNFTVDTGAPVLNITPYSNGTYFDNWVFNTGKEIYLNFTESDPHLQSCWYYNGTANVSLTCGENVTLNITYGNYYLIILYANDSLGFESQYGINVSFRYHILQSGINYLENITELSEQNISLSLLKDSDDTIQSIYLIYNNSLLQMQNAISSNNISSSKIITSPQVTLDYNVSFYFSAYMISGSYFNSSIYNQTVKAIFLDNCSSYSIKILNLSVLDEELQIPINIPTIEAFVELISVDGDTVSSFSKLFYNITPASICINTNFTNYSLSSILKYYGNESYVQEYYYISDSKINLLNIPKNINLYDLKSDDATSFKIYFTGEDYNTVEDAFIYIDRQYITENNSFKTVELPKTDSSGQAVVHLVQNDVNYNIIIVKDNKVIGSFINVRAYCQNILTGECNIFLSPKNIEGTGYSYDNSIGVIVDSISYNESTGIVSGNFIIPDGTFKNVTMIVERNNIFGNRTLCSYSITSSSGMLICSVGTGLSDSEIISNVYVDGKKAVFENFSVDSPDYGSFGFIIWFIITLGMILIFDNKQGILISLIVSYVGAISLGILKGNIIGIAAAGIWLISVTVITLVKINKEHPQ